jgi:2-polyprenyl-3-methyl-5-hydroxy-6-metoxy-1,4-benzoquinol methylase
MESSPPGRDRVTEVNAAYHDAIVEKYEQRGEGLSQDVLSWTRRIFEREVYPALAGASERPAAIDWGCGSGYLEQFLDGRELDLLGIDVSEGMLARAREKFPWGRFESADVYAFEPARQYHLSMEHAVLHHLVDYEVLLDKMAAATLPGGVLFLGNEPNHRAYKYLTPLKKLYRTTINHYRTRDAERLLGDPEFEALSEYHLFYGQGIHASALKRRLIEQHGFREVRIFFSLRELFASIEEGLPRLRLNHWTPDALRDHFPLSRNFSLVAHR